MVAYVFRFDIDPATADEYNQWVQGAVPRLLKTPGLKELRVYRPVTGTSQVVVVYEFADLAGFATWWADAEVQKIFTESRPYQMNREGELWGPSANYPTPLRPSA